MANEPGQQSISPLKIVGGIILLAILAFSYVLISDTVNTPQTVVFQEPVDARGMPTGNDAAPTPTASPTPWDGNRMPS